MKLSSITTLLGSVAILTAFSWLALAQPASERPSSTPQPSTGMMGGPGMMSGNGMMTSRGGMMGNMMRMWGMTPQMLARGRMMMHATLDRDDPATLLGLKDQLGLTDAQSAKLQALADQARHDARGVLTETQRTRLDQLPSASGSMAEMYGQMLAHRQQMHGQHGMGSADSTATPCPMMHMTAPMPMMGASSK